MNIWILVIPNFLSLGAAHRLCISLGLSRKLTEYLQVCHNDQKYERDTIYNL